MAGGGSDPAVRAPRQRLAPHRLGGIGGRHRVAVGRGEVGGGLVLVDAVIFRGVEPRAEAAVADDLGAVPVAEAPCSAEVVGMGVGDHDRVDVAGLVAGSLEPIHDSSRSEEHTSELQSLMRISYAVFCLKKKK